MTVDRLTVQLGTGCNNACSFCAQGSLRERSDSPAGVSEALERGFASGCRAVAFAGGEPTLHDELPDWVRAAVAIGFERVLVQTNGRRLAYSGFAARLVDAGVTGLDVSLHGAVPAVHDYHTRVPGSFLHTVKGLSNATGLPVEPGVTTVVTRSNFRHLGSVVALLARLGVRHWHASATRGFGGAAAGFDRLVPRFAMVRAHLEGALERCRRAGIHSLLSGVPPCVVTAPGALFAAPSDPQRLGFTEVCDGCALRARCSGVDRIYLERFGAGELTALKDSAGSAQTLPTAQTGFVGMGRSE